MPQNFIKFGIRGQLTDVIMCVKFLVDRFRGYGVLTPPKLPFPIDLLRRPYNSVALQCDTVINIICLSIGTVHCPYSTFFGELSSHGHDPLLLEYFITGG